MRRLLQIATLVAVCWFADYVATAAEIQVPQNAVAGAKFALPVSRSGTLYLFGPGTAMKKDVKSGDEIRLTLKHAGHFTAILNGSATSFNISPAAPGELAFIARPSRVPADRRDAISGTVFVFDANRNLVLAPTPVKFGLAVQGGTPRSETVQTKAGVAYVKLDSGRKAGAAQFVASTGTLSVRRVVQQTAADPCNLRMHAENGKDGVMVQTDPVRDCSGNPVPDGTIVTFAAVDSRGRSTIDARIKNGFAQAEFPPLRNARLSVASGVVMGNEVNWEGGL